MRRSPIRLFPLILAGLALCINAYSAASSQAPPRDYTANYRATLGSFDIRATSQLSTLENGQRELRFTAESWFAGIEEFSHFDWSAQGVLVPQIYEYHRTGLGRNRHAVLSFDWAQNSVTNNVQKKPWKMNVPKGALDKLSVQLQLRQDLVNKRAFSEYHIADGGRLKTYSFTVLGEEVIDTALGKLKTLKIKRKQAKDTKRVTTLWLAKDWDYLLVRLHQQEKDGKQYKINLDSATLAQQPVKGLEPDEL